MSEETTWLFDIIIHIMEIFLVVGIACSLYFVKYAQRQRRGRKNIKRHKT